MDLIELKKFIARKGLFARIPLESYEVLVEPEINLGRDIIDSAVLDSLDCSADRKWFNVCCEDFKTICEIANLDPKKVVDRYNVVYERIKLNE